MEPIHKQASSAPGEPIQFTNQFLKNLSKLPLETRFKIYEFTFISREEEDEFAHSAFSELKLGFMNKISQYPMINNVRVGKHFLVPMPCLDFHQRFGMIDYLNSSELEKIFGFIKTLHFSKLPDPHPHLGISVDHASLISEEISAWFWPQVDLEIDPLNWSSEVNGSPVLKHLEEWSRYDPKLPSRIERLSLLIIPGSLPLFQPSHAPFLRLPSENRAEEGLTSLCDFISSDIHHVKHMTIYMDMDRGDEARLDAFRSSLQYIPWVKALVDMQCNDEATFRVSAIYGGEWQRIWKQWRQRWEKLLPEEVEHVEGARKRDEELSMKLTEIFRPAILPSRQVLRREKAWLAKKLNLVEGEVRRRGDGGGGRKRKLEAMF